MANELVKAMLGFGAVIRPHMQTEIREVVASAGLTERDVTILEFVAKQEKTSFGEIAAHLQPMHERGTSTSRLSTTINALFTKRGVLKKEVNPENLRKPIITVTPKGRRILERISQVRTTVYEQIGKALDLDTNEARRWQKTLQDGAEKFRRLVENK